MLFFTWFDLLRLALEAPEQDPLEVVRRHEVSIGVATRRPVVGLTMIGVTMITSSVWPRLKAFERKSAPTTGTVPIAGIRAAFCDDWFCISPAMAKLWPLARSTVVSARRVLSDGTSGSWRSRARSPRSPTFRLIRLPSITVGVKFSPMPKSLNSMLVPSSLTVG